MNKVVKNEMTKDPSRRRLIKSSLGIAASLPLASASLLAASSSEEAEGDAIQFDPNYRRRELRSDSIDYRIIQSPDIAIDPANPGQGRKENLERMLSLLDRSSTFFGGTPDLISFHEMPLHGFGEWDRKQMLRVAAEIPGAETEALGRKAREMNCYISFGTYAKDEDWPDHVLLLGVLIGPDGTVVARHWKARGTLGGLGLFTSTVYECLERYVEMYGWDEVVPVARTDIGNICLTGVQYDPLLFMTMAMKGAELFLRFATGSVPMADAQAMSRSYRVYTGYANSSAYPDHRYYPGGVGTGGSAIVDPSGEPIAVAGPAQGDIRATIPIKAFRDEHRVPSPQWELYEPVFRQFKPRFSPGWFLKYLPESWADTRAYFADKANW